MLSSKDVPTGKNIPYCTLDLFLLAFVQKISVTVSARGKLFFSSALVKVLGKALILFVSVSILILEHPYIVLDFH